MVRAFDKGVNSSRFFLETSYAFHVVRVINVFVCRVQLNEVVGGFYGFFYLVGFV